MSSALISGASIAGPTLAYWLQRHGFAVTVVEHSPGPRPGGQPIDVRGAAIDVMERMELGDALRAKRTRMTGANLLDRQGNEIERHSDRTFSGGRHDSGDVEIFRDDLSSLLYEATKSGVDYRFGDRIVSIDDGAEKISVAFESGSTRDFDLVVGADGVYSGVRRQVFGPSGPFLNYLGSYVAIFTAPNFLGLNNWQTGIWGDDAGMLVLPARAGTELRIFAMIESKPLGRSLVPAQQKALVVERFKDFGWETPRLLAFLEQASDFYFGELAQVRMPGWSRGRAALVGDAAYCPSPRSGQGTSLALVGAYVLAAELARHGSDHAAAFLRYEERMRPFVELNQALAHRTPNEPASEQALDHAKRAIILPSC